MKEFFKIKNVIKLLKNIKKGGVKFKFFIPCNFYPFLWLKKNNLNETLVTC